jgi:uncharacterized protein (TIGR02301 family)
VSERRRGFAPGFTAAALAGALVVATAGPLAAQSAERRPPPLPTPAPGAPAAPAAPDPNAPPPYEPQLMRLAEVLGALYHLRTVCSASDATVWRDRMAALIEAEQPTPDRRDRMAGAFNASFRTWARSYRSCTPAAELAISKFLDEASKIATNVKLRYGP